MLSRIQWDERALARTISSSHLLKTKMQSIGDWQAIKCVKQASEKTHSPLRYSAFACSVDNIDPINGWPVAIIHPTNRIAERSVRAHGSIHW